MKIVKHKEKYQVVEGGNLLTKGKVLGVFPSLRDAEIFIERNAKS